VNKYECAVIVLPSLDSATLETTTKKYTDIITSRGGTLKNIDDWGKRTLAYEINYHREGYYHFYQFEGGADVVKELNRQLRIDENVIRHMIVREEENPQPLMTAEEAAAQPERRPDRRPDRGRRRER
jgi:small subunit ribosomal protein S6